MTSETCFTDTTANLAQDNAYYVKPVIGGSEQKASGSYILKANTAVEPCVVIPLSSGNTDQIHFVWVGDLDGDGEYDFVVDRLNWDGNPIGAATSSQRDASLVSKSWAKQHKHLQH